MTTQMRKTGVDVVGDMPWGTTPLSLLRNQSGSPRNIGLLLQSWIGEPRVLPVGGCRTPCCGGCTAVGCGLLTTLPAAQVFISPCPAVARRSRLPTTARLSLPSVQTVEYALQSFKLLSSFAKFAFRRQALVVGQVLRGFRNERIKIGCGLG
jgi:hypothetical protein